MTMPRKYDMIIVRSKEVNAMPVLVRESIYGFSEDMRQLFGQDLSRIVVYASYARGDYMENSGVWITMGIRKKARKN